MEHRVKGRALRRKLSFANVTAFLALFVALSGTSYAALELPANSVGTRQIKAGAVTNAKLGRRAVDGAKVIPGSLTGSEIAQHSLTGANIDLSTLGTVPSAATAKAAAIARVKVVTATGRNAPAAYYLGSNVAAATASCPSSLVVLGGGVRLSDQTDQTTNDSYPHGRHAWTADVFNGGPGTPTFTVYAICGPVA